MSSSSNLHRTNSRSLSDSPYARVRREVRARFPDGSAVVAEIQARIGRGERVNRLTVQQDDRGLFYGVNLQFQKNWRLALKAAGLDPDQHLLKRAAISDPAEIIAWIHDRHENDQSLRQIDVESSATRYFRSAVSIFGSWGDALEQAGLDPLVFVRSRKTRAPEAEVKLALQRLVVEGDEPLTKERVRQAGWSLLSDAHYWAARYAELAMTQRARWHHILAWLGASQCYRAHRDRRLHAGIQFERLAQSLWPLLDDDTTEHPRITPQAGRGRRYVEPDRARGSELFIEFRLASTVQAVTSAIARYDGLCARLMIVTLEGRYSQPLPEWVEVRSIFDFEALFRTRGGSNALQKLRALSRGERPYVPELWSKPRLIAALHTAPTHLRGNATALRQWYFRTIGQAATKRLDRIRGTFAATCFAEGLTGDPGPARRPHLPQKWRAALLYHVIKSREAVGLPVHAPRLFYSGPREMRRLYDYAWQQYGGWPAMLAAVASTAEPPELPAEFNPVLGAR